MISISLDASMDNIGLSRRLISVISMKYNPTVTFLNELKTIVSEAFTNAIIHGYNNDFTKKVLLEIETNLEGISINIIDEGIGIMDIDLALTPMFSTKSGDDRSGLGFTIIEIFSDSFDVKSSVGRGTKVSIFKKWN